jgi:hypothetical protein
MFENNFTIRGGQLDELEKVFLYNFVQKIKPKTNEKILLKGKVNYMLCNDIGCDPPVDYDFEIEINPSVKI